MTLGGTAPTINYTHVTHNEGTSSSCHAIRQRRFVCLYLEERRSPFAMSAVDIRPINRMDYTLPSIAHTRTDVVGSRGTGTNPEDGL